MPTTSTIPAAKAALLAIFAASTDLAGVDISWGSPTSEDDFEPEMIYLGNVERDKEDRGFQSATEDYTIEVVILVRGYGDNDKEQATEERMWQLHAAIEAAVEADTATLGGVLNETGARVERTRQDNTPLADGWFSRARLDVRCRSVLTD